ncbi:MAG: hypothetical protein IRY87_36865 [Acetobacteraceae bacterium]|nr:hypothetical protein [Siccirubricoccus phaeus]MBX6747637.1 hypothetical protein [Acetobacteraceae bacterium]
MAKGQKRSSREAKKPKQPKAKVITAASPFATARAQAAAPAPAKKR